MKVNYLISFRDNTQSNYWLTALVFGYMFGIISRKMYQTREKPVIRFPLSLIKFCAISLLLIIFMWHSRSVAQSTEGEVQDYPLIPFNTNFWNYWDHYWTTWLDGHPKYEAIELTSFDNPSYPDYKLIRVFLSEKTGNKEQYFYLNDSAAVARSRANTFLRDISYQRSGKANGPQELKLGFTDKDSIEIEWNIRFEPSAELQIRQNKLTPSIHSVGYILLYHLRKNTVSTLNDEILLNGINYAYKKETSDPEGKKSWYNKDIYSAVVIFGRLNFEVENGVISNNWGRRFEPLQTNSRIYRSNFLGKENYIEFEVDELNQIKHYQQRSFDRSFKFSFHPALPNRATAKNIQEIDYSVSFDDNKDLMFGKILIESTDHEMVLHWTNDYPDWARNRPFKSVLTFQENGYELRTEELNN